MSKLILALTFYITAVAFVLLLGVYLLMHQHLMAGGWTLAIGLISFLGLSIKIGSEEDK